MGRYCASGNCRSPQKMHHAVRHLHPDGGKIFFHSRNQCRREQSHMTKQKRIRLLTTWILAAALLTAVAAEANAAAIVRTWGRTTAKTSVQTSKRLPRAYSGEPDSGGGTPAPGGPDALGSTASLPWAMRLLYGGGGVINTLPKHRKLKKGAQSTAG